MHICFLGHDNIPNNRALAESQEESYIVIQYKARIPGQKYLS